MRRMIRRLAVMATAAAMAAGLMTAFEGASGPLPAAHAADGADFRPGLIITDEVFYQSRTMTVADIQSFLNARVPSCAPGYTCLKGYFETTRSQPARAEGCAAYTGQYESAALIIYKVATACGINPRVLLVLLEKEQGLVTDSTPSSRQYRSATGYGCPDTADCDSLYYGFFNQVYHAAWQFKKYRAYPDIRAYRAGRNNTILWHPNTACGSSTVFIENQATAALYIYTPYRPNAAALRNLYGTGDSCSSYGNRNFWRIFTDWFGSTGVAVVADVFKELYASTGGANGPLRLPLAGAVKYSDGGYAQRFEGGRAFRSPAGAAYFTAGLINDEYFRRGGVTSSLGYPNGPYTVVADGRAQSFERGAMYWSRAGGVRSTHGLMSGYYAASGGPTSAVGFPTGDYATHASVGRSQRFERGWLFWGPDTGTVPVLGPIADRYVAGGGAVQPIGFPAKPPSSPAADGTVTQAFEGGRYIASPVGTAYLLSQVEAGYAAAGGPGVLGYPTGNTVAVAGGWTQQFPRAWLLVAPDGTARPTAGILGTAYMRQGGPAGAAGFAVGDYTVVGTGRSQQFQQGTWYWSSAGGARYMPAVLVDRLTSSGGPAGSLGFPIANAVQYGDGVGQRTQRAWLWWSEAGGGQYTTGAIGSYYASIGGPRSALGFPVGPYTAHADGSRSQAFEHGTLRWTAATGVRAG